MDEMYPWELWLYHGFSDCPVRAPVGDNEIHRMCTNFTVRVQDIDKYELETKIKQSKQTEIHKPDDGYHFMRNEVSLDSASLR